MKNTYFLDKIFNVNFREFKNITNAILDELKIEYSDYTCFKTDGEKYLIEIEKESEYIKIAFDDYSMIYKTTKHKSTRNLTSFWNNLFPKFLRKKQKLQFNQNISYEVKN